MTTITTPAAVPRRSPTRTLSDVAVITRRSLRHTLRVPVGLVLSAAMPVIFIVMFNAVFGGAVHGVLPPAADGRYINWLLPGLLAQFALFMGAGTASGLAEDLGRGTIDRFQSLPMARSAVVAGRTVSDLAEAAVTLTLMLLVGATLGFRYQTSLAGMAAGLAVALAFGYAMSWVMATVGLLVRTAEAVQAAVYMVVFPLAFTSSVFVPAQTMPAWLEPFAANQPITVVSDALRGLVLGQGALAPGETVAGQVGLSLAWSVAIVVVSAPLAVRAYRRSVR